MGETGTGLALAFAGGKTVVVTETFGDDQLFFDVELRCVSRKDVERMQDECTVIKFDPRTHERESKTNVPKLRQKLADDCLVSWSGLTAKTAYAMASMELPESVDPTTVVEPTRENKLQMLEYARGNVDGRMQAFEDWLWVRMNSIATARAQTEAAEKKI